MSSKMILIPAGEFIMGSVDEYDSEQPIHEVYLDGYDDENPVHRVYLDAYHIDRYPVTNAEYKKFVEATGHRKPSHWKGSDYPPDQASHPVVNVSWKDAVAYAQWAGKRLPTEAEWEKAARGTDGRRYPWGDEWDKSKCNVWESGIGGTTPVGKYSPVGDSPYGGADMAGNVWEWCNDWYNGGYYTISPARNPMGPPSGKTRTKVVRGGAWYGNGDSAWYSNGDSARSAYRGNLDPSDRDDDVGFRCAKREC